MADPTSDLTAVVQKATSARDAIAKSVAQTSFEQGSTNTHNSLKDGEEKAQESFFASKVLLDQNLSEAEILGNIAK